MFALLRQQNLRRFFIAHGQSQIGTGAGYVALVLIASQRLHSGWAVALVLLADFLPGILLSAWFGVLADRRSRRTLAITAELLRAGAFVALALINSFAATVALALVAGVGTALFRPAMNAALPNLASADDRSRASALYGGLQHAGITLGPAVCALVLLFGPATWVLALNGASFLVSALLLSSVPLGEAHPSDRQQASSGWECTKAGARFAASEPGMLALLIIGALSVLVGAMINVAEPLFATGSLHAGGTGFSFLVAVYGAGMLAGSAYNSRLGASVGTLRLHFLAGVALDGAALLVCAAASNFVGALTGFALAGFANVLLVGPEVRLVQELVTDDFLGRVFGLRDTLQFSSYAVAFVGAGALLSAAGPRAVYVVSGALLLALAPVGFVTFRPARRTVRGPGVWFNVAAETETECMSLASRPWSSLRTGVTARATQEATQALRHAGRSLGSCWRLARRAVPQSRLSERTYSSRVGVATPDRRGLAGVARRRDTDLPLDIGEHKGGERR
jgi:MFS family permease